MKKKLKITASPVTAFDFYDIKREKPVTIYLSTIKKGYSFFLDTVEYKITKIFSKKGIKGKCVELKMISYKISNTVTKHVHNCKALESEMARTDKKHIEKMIKQFGEAKVERMFQGRISLQVPGKEAVCKECGVRFYKNKIEKVKTVEVVSHKGKKKLTKRK